MKFNKTKLFAPVVALSLTMTTTTSCVNDLDVEPINPQTTMEMDADALFNKIYASYCLTGQTGASGNGDLADIDEGRSEFFRMLWYLNEFTADDAHWVWATDAGVPELLHNTFGADNIFSTGLYYRLYFTITLCNFYLDQVNGGDDETLMRRAEVRFIRAMQYFHIMDIFGNAAFTEKVSAELAQYYTRDQFYAYVESELKACEGDLAEPGQNTYGRIDKVAAWNLLSRLYLNAEVYTGAPQWELAKQYAEAVINNGHYALWTGNATNPVTGEEYSAYQMLFLADNDVNGAQKEIIFPAIYHGINTTNYGGTNFLIFSTYSSAMDANVPSGTDCSWGKCTRVRPQLLEKFYGNVDNAPAGKTVAEMTTAANDDRALLYGDGFTPLIEDEGDQAAGYACVKFRNVRSDGESTSSIAYVDTDLPIFRVAEAYLTCAEAITRMNNGVATADATPYIDKLRDRAHANKQNLYSLDDICNEWSREFWFEGRRRMDLVRFGKYAGQGAYKWQWMGGEVGGRQFASHMNIYAIPANDLTNNSNLKQNAGY